MTSLSLLAGKTVARKGGKQALNNWTQRDNNLQQANMTTNIHL